MPDIAADLALNIREFVTTGQCKALNALRREIPLGLRDLLSLPGVGPRRAGAFLQTLDVRDLRALQKAVDAHRVRTVPRFGVRMEDHLWGAMTTHRRRDKRVEKDAFVKRRTTSRFPVA